METQFSRTARLYGHEAVQKLSQCRVAIFGVGGVGGYVVEGLARSGIGALDLIDPDRVCLSNLNRQIIATHATLGRLKVEAACERVLSIHPACRVRTYPIFYLPDTAGQFDFTQYDYVVDAIDTVTGKIALALQAHEAGTPILSAMGAGNKLDPTAFRVSDLSKTAMDPLARVMRKELGRRGIKHMKVVWSPEPPLTPTGAPEPGKRQTPGSSPFAPAAAGLAMAAEVVRDLIGWREERTW